MITNRIRFLALSCLFVGLVVLLSSCSEEEMEMEEETENEMTVIDIGHYPLRSESLMMLPYLSKTEAIFVDSAGERLIIDIVERNLFTGGSGHLYRYNVFEEGDTVKYQYTNESKSFLLSNDSLDLRFSMSLAGTPYYLDPESTFGADVLNIYFSVPDTTFSAAQVFYHVTDPGSWPQHSETDLFPEIEFFDRTFTDVFKNEFSNAQSEVFFNYELGIVSFTDFDDKVWRLEELN